MTNVNNDEIALDEMLATGIVHEINHPIAWLVANLSFIKERIEGLQQQFRLFHAGSANAESLLKNIEDALFPQLVEIVDESIEGAGQIQDVVHNLKRFTHTAEPADSALVNIHEVIGDIIKLTSSQFKRNTKLEKDFSKEIPQLKLNNRKLHQVFLNLIIYAAQSMAEKGNKKNIIRIKTSLAGEYVCIEVSDTGIGIPPTILTKIFDPNIAAKLGAGQGFVICHELVSAMGGKIAVESQLGEGTVVTIHLPLDLKTKSLEQMGVNQNRRLRILAVDDKPVLLKTLQRMLDEHHDVKVTENGRMARAMLIEHAEEMDVIICDVGMPDISGPDLYRFLADKHPELARKLIFIVGDVDAPRMKDFMSGIDNPCVQKPFTKEELMLAIEKVASLRAVGDSSKTV